VKNEMSHTGRLPGSAATSVSTSVIFDWQKPLRRFVLAQQHFSRSLDLVDYRLEMAHEGLLMILPCICTGTVDA
jgi:hypothetical protein